MLPESVTLYYKAGTSDKVYQVCLAEKDGGWVVNYGFAKRGATLRWGTKTNTPLDYAAAKKIYDKIVAGQLKEGYTPGEDGTPYTDTPQTDRATGIFPMLLVTVDDDLLPALMESNDFVAEEKFDGQRIMLKKDRGGKVIGINRDGLQIGIPTNVEKAVASIPGWFVIDGEMVGEEYHTFDIMEEAGKDLRQWGYMARTNVLMTLVHFHSVDPCIQFQQAAQGKSEKAKLFAITKNAGREGIVFKRKTALYTPGRTKNKLKLDGPGGTPSNADYFKYKFVAMATVKVTKINAKRSVAVAVLGSDDERGGKLDLVAVGNVTIKANCDIPEVGDFVEVRYLYAYRQGSLYQPVYIGVRTDKHQADTVASLKYKREPIEAVEE